VLEVLSIGSDRQSLKNCLIVEQSSVLAAVCCSQGEQGKTVAIV